MNSEQGILSAAQMAVEKGSGGAEDEEEEAACDDERVGGEAPELAEDSPLRGRVLHNEAAMREDEGGGDEGEGEGGEANDEAEGEGEAGSDGSRLTKPKKLTTSCPLVIRGWFLSYTRQQSPTTHIAPPRTGRRYRVTRASTLAQKRCAAIGTLQPSSPHPPSCGLQVSYPRRTGRGASCGTCCSRWSPRAAARPAFSR
jgi:hypothetical protein